eukprot:719378_1
MSSCFRIFLWIHSIQYITSYWFNLTNTILPEPNAEMAIGSYNGSIYLIGGLHSSTHGTLTKYSIDLNTFTLIEPTPWSSLRRDTYLFNNGQFWTQQDDILYVSSPDTELTTSDFLIGRL